MFVFSQLAFTSCEDSNEPLKEVIPEQIYKFPIPEKELAIDLGLSVKWAPYNVGASEPKDFGNYYAWGEIEPKNSYSVENYTLDYFWAPDVFGTKYDVAHVKWGSNWRIPTIDEAIELVKNVYGKRCKLMV